MAKSRRAPARAKEKRAPARVTKKRAPGKRAAARGSSRKAAVRKKSAAAKEERAKIVVLDGRRLSRRIEFTGRLIEHIRQRYVEAGEGADVIARSVGVAKATIQRLIREQEWTRAEDGPRDLSRAEQLAAEARALAKKVSAGRAADAGATLPPRSGGEGRRTLRQQGEPGWGASADSATASGADAPLTPTPIPSPQGGGEECDVPSVQDAAPYEQDASPVDVGEAIERLLRLVSAEIGVYENLRATLQHEPQGQREAQKTAHHLATLTSTLETLRRMRAGQTAMVSDDTDDLPADIDAFRESLAQRIEAFFAGRPDAGDAGGPESAQTGGA